MPRLYPILIALTAALTLGLASAQSLPEAAAEALARGEARMAEALVAYPRQYPDRPLWQAAFAEGRRAVSLAPGALEPIRFLAEAYSRSNWYLPAWLTWSDYVRLGGRVADDPEAQELIVFVGHELAYSAYIRGETEDALGYYQAITGLVPEDVDAHVWSGRILLETNRPEQAIAFWQRAVELAPDDARAAYFLELAREQATWGPAAVIAFREGVALYEERRFGEASERFARASTHNPEYPQAWAWLGRVAFEAGRYQDAHRYYTRAATLEPGNQTYAYFRDEAGRRSP
jgi:tetratricopeptide (TPR) repeat protein